MRPYGRIVCFHQPPQWSQQDRVAVVRWMERGLLGYPYRLIRQECWLGRHLLTCRWPVNQLVPVHFLDIRPRAAAPSHPCPSQLSTISQIPITSNCTRIKHTWCGRTKLSLICGRVSKGHKICSELPTLSDTTSAYPLRWTGAMIAAERTRRALRAIRREFMMCWGINWDCRCWQDGTFLLGYKPSEPLQNCARLLWDLDYHVLVMAWQSQICVDLTRFFFFAICNKSNIPFQLGLLGAEKYGRTSFW